MDLNSLIGGVLSRSEDFLDETVEKSARLADGGVKVWWEYGVSSYQDVQDYLSGFVGYIVNLWGEHSTTIYQIATIVFFALLVHVLFVRAYHRLEDRLSLTRRFWDELMLAALFKPTILLIWLMALVFILQKINSIYGIDSGNSVFSPVLIKDIAILFSLGWFLIRFILTFSERLIASNTGNIDKSTIHTVRTLLLVTIIILITLGFLQAFGISITGVLAFGGVGGLILGFAAKDMLANLFGGLMVHLDCPFTVGEWIRAPDKNIEGIVEHIGWRQTRLLTLEKIPVYVPNAIFTNISVENKSRMRNRRIKEIVGLRYEDISSLPGLVAAMRDYITNHPGIDKSVPAYIHFYGFGASSLDCLVHCFTLTVNRAEYLKVREEILLHIMDIVKSHGADIAFPTQNIYLSDTSDDAAFSKK